MSSFLSRLSSCQYPWNMFFLDVFVSRNHTKIHALLFYLLPILKDLIMNILCFFFDFCDYEFSEKNCCMIVWFWYQIIPSCFSCYKLDISMFSHIFYSFYKNCIVHQLESLFSRIQINVWFYVFFLYVSNIFFHKNWLKVFNLSNFYFFR